MGFDLRTANGNGKVLNLASNYASLFTYLMTGLVVFHIGIPCAVRDVYKRQPLRRCLPMWRACLRR